MSKNLISTSSKLFDVSQATIWEALVNKNIARKYFFGASIVTDWKVGGSIIFEGEFNGHKYKEKGVILAFRPNVKLQYSHWSNFDGLPDEPENYRIWTFDLADEGGKTRLSISEDNIPTEKQKIRSDQFWREVLEKINTVVN